ncbi:MAG: TonB-dependent receptor [Balneolaceae bacterium]
MISSLSESLDLHGLALQFDRERKQVLIHKSIRTTTASRSHTISGQFLDAETGERLPFATLYWIEENRTRGQAADQSGSFQIQVTTSDPILQMRGSYMGYEETELSIELRPESRTEEVTIRLDPANLTGNEIIITGTKLTPQDPSLTGLIRTDRFSPLGEGNALRSLQILPSVASNPAMYQGLHVRGSSVDGFQVELDGIDIFNQSHLFGMLDSFNEDAIQSSGFYYDVAPADKHIPTGGQLSLTTRNGSLVQTDAIASLSSSSLRAVMHGPLQKGRSSWLIAGRTSYMNEIQLFNNRKLIRWGMDIDRPHSMQDQFSTLDTKLVSPGPFQTYFYDIHGKLYREEESGSRSMVSIYAGGDRTTQVASRNIRNYQSEERFEEIDVETYNRWNNFSATFTHHRSLSENIYSHTNAGISAYETVVKKEDFTYSKILETVNTSEISTFIYPFASQSMMNQIKIDQSLDLFTGKIYSTIGFTGTLHRGEYLEESFDRLRFITDTNSFQADLYIQTETDLTDAIHLQIGSRLHYFQNGSYLNWSPRSRIRLFKNSPVSFSAGFSRNIQYLHQIEFNNLVTSQIWILSNREQPPSTVNHLSTGIYVKPGARFYLQVEAYHKNYNNIRLHELNARSLTETFGPAPWFHDNSGTAKGLEFLIRKEFSLSTVTQTYTLSSMELQNENLNGGEPFYASWDRTHMAVTHLEVKPLHNTTLFLSWLISSGTPVRLPSADSVHGESLATNRHSFNSRVDLSVQHEFEAGHTRIQTKVSVYNLLNRQNEWYSENRLALETGRTVPFFRPVPVTVYDLGFHPSFEIKFLF